MDTRSAKSELRRRLRGARLERSHAARDEAAEGLLRAAIGAGLGDVHALAGYLPMPSEPDVEPLLDALGARGAHVLVPVPRPDRQMAWGYHSDDRVFHDVLPVRMPAVAELGVGARALLELGIEVVLVPALAVSWEGVRLGQGGGYYDRLLAELPAQVWRAGVVFSEEFVPSLPAEEHDARMTHVLTPDGLQRLPRS